MALAALRPGQVREGSGLEGVVRGIGGAFGVALTGVILEKRHSWHYGYLVEDHGLASIDSVRLLDGVRGLLGRHGAVGSFVDVQARSLLNREFEQAAQVSAFQDALLLLALLQIAALVPTLLIRAPGKETVSQPTAPKNGYDSQ
jgi:DHA2 family multidrug resistance protein